MQSNQNLHWCILKAKDAKFLLRDNEESDQIGRACQKVRFLSFDAYMV